MKKMPPPFPPHGRTAAWPMREPTRAAPILVYCAADNETAVECEVIDLGCGAGRIECLECGGDGNWGKFAPELVGADMPCRDCKGTGWQLVSI